MKLTDYLSGWLDNQRHFVEISTWEGYEYIINAHALPYFICFDYELESVRGYDIQQYFSSLLDNGLSVRTVRKHRAVLHKAFSDAVFNEILDINVIDRTRLPRSKRYRSSIYTAAQIKYLLMNAKDSHIYTPVFLTCYYGFRRSEVLGLKWQNVNFEDNTITVCHTVTEVRTMVIRDGTKNESSERVMPLVPAVREYLLGLERSSEYICVKADGTLITPGALSKAWKRLIIRLGLPPIRFHDLRHSNISILLNSGMSLKHISSWAGHSSINITADIYSHLDVSSKKLMGEKINDLLSDND